jgi:CRP/FNR family cyclic AMP-dependent transcriptional regulator
MPLIESLKKVQIFTGLSQEELKSIAALCQERTLNEGDTILSEGESTRELFIIAQGMVEVTLGRDENVMPLMRLGAGQLVGEMSLVDRGVRSATATAVSDDTVLYVVPHAAFLALCEEDNHIGFVVMRNLAAELSLRLRYYNIAGQSA